MTSWDDSSERLGFVLLLCALSGCANRALTAEPRGVAAPPVPILPAEPQELERTPDPALPSTGILVWTRAADGTQPATTHWLVADADGGLREAARLDGVVIAAGGALYRYIQEDHEIDTYTCDSIMADKPVVGGKGHVQRALIERVGDRSQFEIVPAPSADMSEQYEHSITLEGSAGRYLFVRESGYDYSCGAHGGSSASFSLFDAEQRKTVEPLDAEERARIDANERVRAAADALEEDEIEAKKPEDFSLAMLRPRYDDHGRLAIDYQFWTFACYACGDGEWGSYSRSAFVPANPLPRQLTQFANPPPQLSHWLATARDAPELRGWSLTTDSEAERVALASLSAESNRRASALVKSR